jgi:GH18 family chitinase
MYNPTNRIAISYENPESIQNKAAFVRRMNLGGMMVWELGFDDEQFTLLSTINNALGFQPNGAPPPAAPAATEGQPAQ